MMDPLQSSKFKSEGSRVQEFMNKVQTPTNRYNCGALNHFHNVPSNILMMGNYQTRSFRLTSTEVGHEL